MAQETTNINTIFVLNLKTLRWQRRSPTGPHPLTCDKLSSWTYENKIFIFGGFGPKPVEKEIADALHGRQRHFQYVLDETNYYTYDRGWNNQCAAYNLDTDAWEWPRIRGDTPCARAAHATTCK